ncbi:MAG: prepilin-type N-terminal cleavage/methylation domain-containing protein [Patescibacteria group bacterium]
MIGFKYKQKQINWVKRFDSGAFTLMEVMVSVALFSVIMLSITTIFKLAIDGQRSAIATQNVQESLKYFLEVTAKEMRMAQKNEGVCFGLGDDQIFKVDHLADGTDGLSFKNYYGECVSYTVAYDTENEADNPRFRVARRSGSVVKYDWISPAKIKIEGLRFFLNDADPTAQPMVTISLKANAIDSAQFKSEMTLQTSITSRYYK